MSARIPISTLLLALGAACSPPPPTVTVVVAEGAGAPAVIGLARLQLIVGAACQDTPLVDQALPVQGDDPAPLEVALLPGAEFYVHMQGWLACNPPCIQPDVATAGDCVCFDDLTPSAQILRAEGCTDWRTAAEDTQVTVSLSDRLGLCPPAPRTCGP
jgi:hypothetical protein